MLPDDDHLIYKVCAATEWQEAEASGSYLGSAVDGRDGFIHFSTAAQLPETLRRHFAGRGSLVLVAVDPAAVGPALRWEPSRGGALFPHLYGALSVSSGRVIAALDVGADGSPRPRTR